MKTLRYILLLALGATVVWACAQIISTARSSAPLPPPLPGAATSSQPVSPATTIDPTIRRQMAAARANFQARGFNLVGEIEYHPGVPFPYRVRLQLPGCQSPVTVYVVWSDPDKPGLLYSDGHSQKLLTHPPTPDEVRQFNLCLRA